MARLLQVVGVLALLGWTGGGVAAWMLTKEQVSVQISPDGAGESAGTQALAGLEDRIATLESDLRALTRALGENLGAMDEALREDQARHAQDLGASVHRIETLVERARGEQARATAGLDARLVALDTELDGLASHAATLAADSPAEPSPGEASLAEAQQTASGSDRPSVTAPILTADAAPGAGNDPITATDEPAPAEVQEPTAAAPPRKRSFLAFDLPSDDFRFDERRTWTVVPELSRVGFDAKSTLHDFTGVTSKLSASFSVDLAHPGDAPTGRVVVDATDLDTGLEDRDVAMREHLDTEHHDQIVWELTGFESATIDADQQSVTGTVRGRMTIHGITRETSTPVKLHVDKSRRLVMEGEMMLKLPDYEVPVPNKLGLISMEEDVRVWLSLRARPEARESH